MRNPTAPTAAQTKKAKTANQAANAAVPKCPSCGRHRDTPYRRKDTTGHIYEGCVNSYHDGAVLLGDSARWHNHPESQKIRREWLLFMAAFC